MTNIHMAVTSFLYWMVDIRKAEELSLLKPPDDPKKKKKKDKHPEWQVDEMLTKDILDITATGASGKKTF